MVGHSKDYYPNRKKCSIAFSLRYSHKQRKWSTSEAAKPRHFQIYKVMVVLGNGHVHIKHVVVFCCLDFLHLQWELLLDCNTAWNILVADESSHWKRAACIVLLQCYPIALLLQCSRDEGSRCARPLKGKPKDEMWMYFNKEVQIP